MASITFKKPAVLFRMTSDQFCALPPSDEYKLELLDGEVIVAARPAPNHQHFLGQLYVVLSLWVKQRRLGRFLLDTLMKLNDVWTPAPDLSFLKTAHLKRVQKKRIAGPVDLAIEIMSPSTEETDLETKFATYAEAGIPWYWIVDLEARRLYEYKLVEAEYGGLVTAAFDKPFKPRAFPGLKIDLASLEW